MQSIELGKAEACTRRDLPLLSHELTVLRHMDDFWPLVLCRADEAVSTSCATALQHPLSGLPSTSTILPIWSLWNGKFLRVILPTPTAAPKPTPSSILFPPRACSAPEAAALAAEILASSPLKIGRNARSSA